MPLPTNTPMPAPSAEAQALLNPRMARLLSRIQQAGPVPLRTLAPPDARRAYLQAAEVLDLPRAPLARVQDITVPGAGGVPLPARVYARSHAPAPVLLYLHGGGFVVGGLDTHNSLCRQLALRSGWAVVALDYRLAPEYPFPTAVNDAWAALQHLAQAGSTLGLLAHTLAVGGDSAGGTLAAVTALQARDHGLALALQVLVTPGTAALPNSASHHRFAQGLLLDRLTLDWMCDHYAHPSVRHDWRFAPLLANTAGVAPACLVLAECDPLVDEALAYGSSLRAAGVPVVQHLYPGVTHDFIKLGRVLPEAALAQAAIAGALAGVYAVNDGIDPAAKT
jgi:acetyl esterase